MSQLEQYQPFGTRINPFGSEFLERLNALGEIAGRYAASEEAIERVLRMVFEEPKQGAGGGVAVVGRVFGVAPGPYGAGFNRNYHVELLDGTLLPPMEPNGRMFDPEAVDHHEAAIGEQVRLFPLPPDPFSIPVAPMGGCVATDGTCSFTNLAGCSGEFLGEGVPCARMYVTEKVKISECPESPPPGIVPPPQIINQQDLLT
jgi:hypothetical protein